MDEILIDKQKLIAEIKVKNRTLNSVRELVDGIVSNGIDGFTPRLWEDLTNYHEFIVSNLKKKYYKPIIKLLLCIHITLNLTQEKFNYDKDNVSCVIDGDVVDVENFMFSVPMFHDKKQSILKGNAIIGINNKPLILDSKIGVYSNKLVFKNQDPYNFFLDYDSSCDCDMNGGNKKGGGSNMNAANTLLKKIEEKLIDPNFKKLLPNEILALIDKVKQFVKYGIVDIKRVEELSDKIDAIQTNEEETITCLPIKTYINISPKAFIKVLTSVVKFKRLRDKVSKLPPRQPVPTLDFKSNDGENTYLSTFYNGGNTVFLADGASDRDWKILGDKGHDPEPTAKNNLVNNPITCKIPKNFDVITFTRLGSSVVSSMVNDRNILSDLVRILYYSKHFDDIKNTTLKNVADCGQFYSGDPERYINQINNAGPDDKFLNDNMNFIPSYLMSAPEKVILANDKIINNSDIKPIVTGHANMVQMEQGYLNTWSIHRTPINLNAEENKTIYDFLTTEAKQLWDKNTEKVGLIESKIDLFKTLNVTQNNINKMKTLLESNPIDKNKHKRLKLYKELKMITDFCHLDNDVICVINPETPNKITVTFKKNSIWDDKLPPLNPDIFYIVDEASFTNLIVIMSEVYRKVLESSIPLTNEKVDIRDSIGVGYELLPGLISSTNTYLEHIIKSIDEYDNDTVERELPPDLVDNGNYFKSKSYDVDKNEALGEMYKVIDLENKRKLLVIICCSPLFNDKYTSNSDNDNKWWGQAGVSELYQNDNWCQNKEFKSLYDYELQATKRFRQLLASNEAFSACQKSDEPSSEVYFEIEDSLCGEPGEPDTVPCDLSGGKRKSKKKTKRIKKRQSKKTNRKSNRKLNNRKSYNRKKKKKKKTKKYLRSRRR